MSGPTVGDKIVLEPIKDQALPVGRQYGSITGVGSKCVLDPLRTGYPIASIVSSATIGDRIVLKPTAGNALPIAVPYSVTSATPPPTEHCDFYGWANNSESWPYWNHTVEEYNANHNIIYEISLGIIEFEWDGINNYVGWNASGSIDPSWVAVFFWGQISYDLNGHVHDFVLEDMANWLDPPGYSNVVKWDV